MRPTALLLPLLLLTVAPIRAAETPSTAPATGWSSIKATACQETDRMMDWREISCAIPAGAAGRQFRFQAMFTGGHDDTSASLAPELDGQAFTCEDGSKLSLFGEDGDVSVHCRFSGAATAGKPGRLKVLIKWSHAQYADFEFLAE